MCSCVGEVGHMLQLGRVFRPAGPGSIRDFYTYQQRNGSAAVIERCGGVLGSVVASEIDARAVRRYWIE